MASVGIDDARPERPDTRVRVHVGNHPVERPRLGDRVLVEHVDVAAVCRADDGVVVRAEARAVPLLDHLHPREALADGVGRAIVGRVVEDDHLDRGAALVVALDRLEAREKQLAARRVDDRHRHIRRRPGAVGHRVRPRASSASSAESTRSTAVLAAQPLEQVAHPVLERDLGLEAEQLLGEARVRVAVADVAGAVASDHLGLEVHAEAVREHVRHIEHGRRAAGADVDGASVRSAPVKRELTRAHDVAHVDEVARLVAVLEHEWGALRQEPRREDGRDAGVRVAERLALAVDVEEAQRDGGNVVRGADRERHLLVVALADGVDRRRPERLRLGGRLGLERRARRRRARPTHAARAARRGRNPGASPLSPVCGLRCCPSP